MEFTNQLTGEKRTAEPWQLELKVGSFYKNEHPIAGTADKDGYTPVDATLPTVYGQIVEAGPEEGFFTVKAYSQACPDGETGLFCICDASAVLTEEEFNEAKQKGWT